MEVSLKNCTTRRMLENFIGGHVEFCKRQYVLKASSMICENIRGECVKTQAASMWSC